MKPGNSETLDGRNVTLFLVSVALVFLLRSLWTYPIEHGDAIQKYFYAAEILRTGDWSILLHNHHSLRWAAMLPQTGITWLLGTRYEVFFVLPLLMFSLYVVLIVFSLRNILNSSQQLLLWAVLMSEASAYLTSNQYLIVGLGIFFVFVGVLLLTHEGKRQNLLVVLAALSFFIAYGAHVTYLSFAAGGFLWLLLFQSQPSRAAIFCLTILLLMLFETLVINYLSDWQLTMGRLEALADGPHVKRNLTYVPVVFGQLLSRWWVLPLPYLLLCMVFIMTGPWLVRQRIMGRKVPGLIECTFMVGLCFAIGITFAIYSIHPLRPAVPIDARYLIPFFPFASIVAVFVLVVIASKPLTKLPFRVEPVASIIFALILLVYPTFKLDFFRTKFDAFIWKSHKEYSTFSDLVEKGELILTGNKKIAFSMIVRFRKPVDVQYRETWVSSIKPSPNSSCVRRLSESPLHLNYEDCTYWKRP